MFGALLLQQLGPAGMLPCQPLYLLGHFSWGSETATFTITGAPPTAPRPPATALPTANETNLGTDCDSAIPLV